MSRKNSEFWNSLILNTIYQRWANAALRAACGSSLSKLRLFDNWIFDNWIWKLNSIFLFWNFFNWIFKKKFFVAIVFSWLVHFYLCHKIGVNRIKIYSVIRWRYLESKFNISLLHSTLFDSFYKQYLNNTCLTTLYTRGGQVRLFDEPCGSLGPHACPPLLYIVQSHEFEKAKLFIFHSPEFKEN